jgi:uncharacterized protein (TIGR02284 family)
MTTATTECVGKLNGLLKGERSACETYRQAIEKTQDAQIKSILEANHSCHSGRVQTLSNKINELGGEPVQDSGAWGAFANLIQGGATVFGDKASIATLEEGEDKGLADYKNLLQDASSEVKQIVGQLMPKQEGTHAKMRDLKHSLA